MTKVKVKKMKDVKVAEYVMVDISQVERYQGFEHGRCEMSRLQLTFIEVADV